MRHSDGLRERRPAQLKMKDQKDITDRQVADPVIELPERSARPEDTIQNIPQDAIYNGTHSSTE